MENDEPTYLHNDLLGSPVAGTDKFGNVIWQEHYTPYGEKIRNSAANDDLGSFTGHIDDSSTGLTYMQARYYDPVVGRFLSNDPVSFTGHVARGNSAAHGFNRYAYVNNNPYKYTDPNGEFLAQAIGGVVGGIVNTGLAFAANGGSLTLSQAAGAFAGGATTGALVASGVPLTAANAAGAAVGSTIEQGVDIATGKADSFSIGKVATETAAGAALGKVGDTAVKGITKGQGNMAATFKGQVTRMANGNSSSMSSSTIAKGVTGGLVGGANRAVATGVVNESGVKEQASQAIDTAAKQGACGAMGVAICD